MLKFYIHPKHTWCLYWTTSDGKPVALDLNSGYILNASVSDAGNKLTDEQFAEAMQRPPFREVEFLEKTTEWKESTTPP